MSKHAPISGTTAAAATGEVIDRAVDIITKFSASASNSASEPTESEAAPELTPLIAEILRTRCCSPGSVVLVEGVDVAYTTPDNTASRFKARYRESQSQSQRRRWRVVRLLLGDGELCIQSLLAPEMHRYVDAGEIAFGSYIRLDKFRLAWLNVGAEHDSECDNRGMEAGGRENCAAYEGDATGTERTAYLVIEDMVLVGWDRTLFQLMQSQDLETETGEDSTMDDKDEEPPPPSPSLAQSPSAAVKSHAGHGERDLELEERAEAADLDAGLERMPAQRQEVEQDQTAVNSHQAIPLPAQIPQIQETHRGNPMRRRASWQSTDPSKPLKLTPLRAIPHLPFKQNWSVNVLAIVTAVTEVEPSGIPPYTQRRAWLADPSTRKRVQLTVFLDPGEFAPRVGGAVLLLGVKNHRFDGGSLKKYASDRPAGGNGEAPLPRWWFEDPDDLDWCDAAGLRRWWGEQQKLEQQQQQQERQQ